MCKFINNMTQILTSIGCPILGILLHKSWLQFVNNSKDFHLAFNILRFSTD